MITIIAAYSQNSRIIGAQGKIPWALSSEMSHFRKTTTGSAVIFGRKTFDSIAKPLPNRLNIVISKNQTKSVEGVILCRSIKEAVSTALEAKKQNKIKDIFICGGESIYKQALKEKLAERLILSEIDEKLIPQENLKNADRFFPEINEKEWKLSKTIVYEEFTVKEFYKVN